MGGCHAPFLPVGVVKVVVSGKHCRQCRDNAKQCGSIASDVWHRAREVGENVEHDSHGPGPNGNVSKHGMKRVPEEDASVESALQPLARAP